jgi:acyl transferase domain-containing protein/NADPH:quinone reductase-like Zn-dependent oxidoreductase
LGKNRTVHDPLYIGSVKSNLGHLEAASGITAIIKSALMLERGFLLPNHDFKKPNTKVPWKDWNMKVCNVQRPWPKGKKYISVNNFGFGGTNAHVVLGKAPHTQKPRGRSISPPSERSSRSANQLFVISANDKDSLATIAKKLVIYLEQRPEIFQLDLMRNVAYTLQRKSLLRWRLAIPASTSFELIEAINTSKYNPGKESDPVNIGFIFTGQGAQWYGMGRELYARYPVYAAAIDRADNCLKGLGSPWSLLEELKKDADKTKVSEAHISQPSCTAVQIGLVDLLRSWGIHPKAVAGHSSGEIAAAYAAGIISFDSAISISYFRGSLIPTLKKKLPLLEGRMMAVGGTASEIQLIIDELKNQRAVRGESEQIRIACYNSPTSFTISGDDIVLRDLEIIMENKQVFHRRLMVDVAYHSHHMNFVAKEYQEALRSLPRPLISDVWFFSSLYGRRIEGLDCDAHYWVNNLTCPVRFSDAVEAMVQPVGDLKSGVDILIELGPHCALQGPLKQILKSVGATAAKIPYASPLIRGRDAVDTAMELAGSLITKGVRLKLEAINSPEIEKRIPMLLTDLPRYSWNHQTKYWHESRMTEMHKYRKGPRNDLIGVEAIYSTDLEPTWRNIVKLDDLPWLRDHQIQSVTIFPISGFISMAIEAAAQLSLRRDFEFDHFEVRNVSIAKPLSLSDRDVETTITLRPIQDTNLSNNELWSSFRILSWSQAGGWTEHCVGLIATQHRVNDKVGLPAKRTIYENKFKSFNIAAKVPETAVVSRSELYLSLSKLGVNYGPAFQGIQNCKATSGHSSGIIKATDFIDDMPNNYQTACVIHPTFLESVIQMYWPIISADGSNPNQIYLPTSIGRLSLSREITTLAKFAGSKIEAFCAANFSCSVARVTKAELFVTQQGGNVTDDPLLEINALEVSPIIEGHMEPVNQSPRELCYKLEWELVFDRANSYQRTTINTNKRIPTCNGLGELPTAMDVAIIHGDSSFQRLVANSLAIRIEEATSKLPSIGTVDDIIEYEKHLIVLTEIDEPFLSKPNERRFKIVHNMLNKAHGVLWIVRGAYESSTSPKSNIISGLSRSIRSESLLRFSTLDLDGVCQLSEEDATTAIFDTFSLGFGGTPTVRDELEFMERAGKLFTPRVINDDVMNNYVYRHTSEDALVLQDFDQQDRPLKLQCPLRDIDARINFMDDFSSKKELLSNEIEFVVKAVGMNLHDTGLIGNQSSSFETHKIGIEASGIVSRIGSGVTSFKVGDRVAGFTLASGAYSSRTRVSFSKAFILPNALSFEDAATIPVAYSTAYYSMFQRATLQAGQTILIHAAASDIGQAAVFLAQMIGATVFATVNSLEEKVLVMTHCNIPEEQVFYSRSSSFSSLIRQATCGEGVDLILNALPGDVTLQESWTCLNTFGTLVDIAQGYKSDRPRLGFDQANSNASFISVNFIALATGRPDTVDEAIAKIAQLIQDAAIQPITSVARIPISKLEDALINFHTNKSFSKFIVVPSRGDMVLVRKPHEQHILSVNNMLIF